MVCKKIHFHLFLQKVGAKTYFNSLCSPTLRDRQIVSSWLTSKKNLSVISRDLYFCILGRGLMFAQQLAKRILEDYGKEITLLLSSQNTDIQVDLFFL